MYEPRRTHREVLAGQITADMRTYGVHAEHVGHAFAARHGLGATDLHALVAIMDAEREGDPLTPGRLAEELNLSTGSITGLLDRLENAGHVRRDRDTSDRRKIFLRYAERGAKVAVEFFTPLGTRTRAVMDTFTDDELEIVARFMRGMVTSMAEHRDALRSGGA